MRLDFNVILVDDEVDDPDNRRSIFEYKRVVEDRLKLKGFNPLIEVFSNPDSVASLPLSKKRRIDLYISDNNLGENEHEIKEGIDLYLTLKKQFQCDFLLYTRSNKQSIIQKLIKDLSDEQDPNLFTKFSFVSRSNSNEWHSFTFELINRIVKIREEFNNLRGLFAAKISKIQIYLKSLHGFNEEDNIDLIDILKISHEKQYITLNQWQRLTKLRYLRNALLHNDEVYDGESDCYKLEYKEPSFSNGTNFTLNSKWLIESTTNYTDLRRQLDLIEREILP
ncbi:hypothetical protein RMB13_14360 [Acinetobacter sp. V102_4]|uniref:hypothetical protein n=1 Tax=Acinetobacter TaxID=469 RepID=UPI000DD060CB|nr:MULTISPECIES: hypothetical protein [Acinetobacter]MBN6533573.1 hypothetical protein [Acinetobacter pittii]MDS7930633.1 hypothetical protein [Acinetobacter sp. V102_4]